MLEKLKALWALMEAGKAVSDPKLWKQRQVKSTAVVALLMAVVNMSKGFGYELPIDETTANAIGAGILGVVNVVLTITTSDKVGLAAKPDSSNEEPAKQQENIFNK